MTDPTLVMPLKKAVDPKVMDPQLLVQQGANLGLILGQTRGATHPALNEPEGEERDPSNPRTLDPDEYEGYGEQMQGDEELTPAEKKSRNVYGSMDPAAMDLNDYHRHPDEYAQHRQSYPSLLADPEVLDEHTKNLDAAIAKSTLPESLSLFRGAADAGHVFGTTDPDQLTGKTFRDKGYTSLSANPQIALDYANQAANGEKGSVNPGGTAILQFNVPQGSNALHMGDTKHSKGKDSLSEFVLPRASDFKVKKASRTSEHPHLMIELEKRP